MAVTQQPPPYPSTHTRKSLSPGQLAQLNQTIVSFLARTLALPPSSEQATPAFHKFLSSYAKDTASRVLQSLIWGTPEPASNDDKVIRKQVLRLAEKLALSGSPGIDVQTLLDLIVIYAPTNPTQTRPFFASTLKNTTSLAATFETEVVSTFTALLAPARSSGLYALRKIVHCISCTIHVSPPTIIRSFSRNKDFIVALGSAYDEGLGAIAHSYGGLHIPLPNGRDLDEWERVWLETKVALMDSFHILLDQMLKDMSAASGSASSAESERTFDILFTLLDLPSSAPSQSSPTTPFFNRSLLADYQHAYDLSQTLASTVGNAEEKDARLDVIEGTLRSLESNGQHSNEDPGALKLLIRSSPPAIPLPSTSNLGKNTGKTHTSNLQQATDKGKSKAPFRHPTPPPQSTSATARLRPRALVSEESGLDLKVTQVLDILPDYSPTYIHVLLTHPAYPFRGNAEKVIEALLEGTAPTPKDIDGSPQVDQDERHTATDHFVYTKERKNVFDHDVMNLSQVHFGKKRQDETAVLDDRRFIEEMKADILRRAEAISDEEDEEDAGHRDPDSKGAKGKSIAVAYEEELGLDGLSALKVVGDGEESSEGETGDDGDDRDDDDGQGGKPQGQTPETILEIAYIRDPRLFDRDAQVRRGRLRADLKAQTGWTDEQIEGWRIMLERNPKKDKILQKHEFSGNKARQLYDWSEGGSNSDHSGGHGRGGQGNGRGGGSRGGVSRGGGRGRGGTQGATDGGSARERAWKDKNKASRGNHNRKRGHDKKMARAGGPS